MMMMMMMIFNSVSHSYRASFDAELPRWYENRLVQLQPDTNVGFRHSADRAQLSDWRWVLSCLIGPPAMQADSFRDNCRSSSSRNSILVLILMLFQPAVVWSVHASVLFAASFWINLKVNSTYVTAPFYTYIQCIKHCWLVDSRSPKSAGQGGLQLHLGRSEFHPVYALLMGFDRNETVEQ